jgi:hypothetical protein
MKEPLLFKRQFILSSWPEYNFDEWNNIQLGNSAYLSFHPELEFVHLEKGAMKLTLLGFWVDPFYPDKTNAKILLDVLENSHSFNDVVKNSYPLGGRWLLIYQGENSFKILTDPVAQRQLYYFKKKELFLCGSDPSLLNHFYKLEKDSSTDLVEFTTSKRFIEMEKVWIGDETIFKNVKHLMPNHYLDVLQWKAIRFFPSEPLGKTGLEEVVIKASDILKGLITGVANRQPLAIAVTAGWDSRVLLAASKDVQDRVHYFVSSAGNNYKKHPDVFIPSKLFKDLNMPFEVQVCNETPDEEFLKYFGTNISIARKGTAKVNYIFRYMTQFADRLNINGNISEIARVCIRPLIPMKITGSEFTKLQHITYNGNKYVARQFDLWIEDAYRTCVENDYNLFDLLYWEQRLGNWCALYAAEQDIAIDQFSPFNNRLLLNLLLSVDEKYRLYPNFILYRKMIERLWPEVLSEPIGKKKLKKEMIWSGKYLLRKMSGAYKKYYLPQNMANR